MRKIEVEVTYKYTLQVDDTNHIVREYDSDDDMLDDLAVYQFRTLPVMKEKGVLIDDISVVGIAIT